jgi:hypothetical protein
MLTIKSHTPLQLQAIQPSITIRKLSSFVGISKNEESLLYPGWRTSKKIKTSELGFNFSPYILYRQLNSYAL